MRFLIFRLSVLILKLTHRMWNRRISAILCQAYQNRVINSHQLHELAAKFDPTTGGDVYKVCRPFRTPPKEVAPTR